VLLDPDVQNDFGVKIQSPRNLGRLNNSCYISAPVQLLFSLIGSIPDLAAFSIDPQATNYTARDTRVLHELGGEQTPKLTDLHDALGGIFRHLSRSGDQLSKGHTLLLQNASEEIRSRWRDEEDDAVEYYVFLLDMYDIALDRSSVANIESYGNPLEVRQQALQLAIADGSRDLHAEAEEFLEAYFASGHENGLARAHTIQICNKVACSTCGACLPDYSHNWTLKIRVPENVKGDETFPLENAIRSALKDRADAVVVSQCLLCRGYSWDETAHVNVTNVPQFLAIECNRGEYVEIPPDAADASSNKEVQGFIVPRTNRISGLQQLDLGKFSKTPEKSIMYDHVGQLGYVGSGGHWMAHFKIGPKHSGDWFRFDDTERFPMRRSPYDERSSTYSEALIVYRLRNEATQAAAMLNVPPMQVQRPAPLEKLTEALVSIPDADVPKVFGAVYQNLVRPRLDVAADQILTDIQKELIDPVDVYIKSQSGRRTPERPAANESATVKAKGARYGEDIHTDPHASRSTKKGSTGRKRFLSEEDRFADVSPPKSSKARVRFEKSVSAIPISKTQRPKLSAALFVPPVASVAPQSVLKKPLDLFGANGPLGDEDPFTTPVRQSNGRESPSKSPSRSTSKSPTKQTPKSSTLSSSKVPMKQTPKSNTVSRLGGLQQAPILPRPPSSLAKSTAPRAFGRTVPGRASPEKSGTLSNPKFKPFKPVSKVKKPEPKRKVSLLSPSPRIKQRRERRAREYIRVLGHDADEELAPLRNNRQALSGTRTADEEASLDLEMLEAVTVSLHNHHPDNSDHQITNVDEIPGYEYMGAEDEEMEEDV
jgi:hypothetical protein